MIDLEMHIAERFKQSKELFSFGKFTNLENLLRLEFLKEIFFLKDGTSSQQRRWQRKFLRAEMLYGFQKNTHAPGTLLLTSQSRTSRGLHFVQLPFFKIVPGADTPPILFCSRLYFY